MTEVHDWSSTIAPGDHPDLDGSTLAVNQIDDRLRETRAAIRRQWDDAEWWPAASVTWVSGTEFRISGDVTAEYHQNRRVRAQGSATGTIYGHVSAVAYSAPDTTVTVTWASGSMSNDGDLVISRSILSAVNRSIPDLVAAGVLGNAAQKDIGTSGDAVPVLNAANTFSGVLTVTGKITSDDPTTGQLDTDGGRTTIGTASHWRTLQNGVYLGRVRAAIDALSGAVATALSFRIDTMQGGAVAERMRVGRGLVVGSPDGEDRGDGSVNAQSLNINGNPVRNPVRMVGAWAAASSQEGATTQIFNPNGFASPPDQIWIDFRADQADAGQTVGTIVRFGLAPGSNGFHAQAKIASSTRTDVLWRGEPTVFNGTTGFTMSLSKWSARVVAIWSGS